MSAPGVPALGGLDAIEIKLNFDAARIDDALRVFGFAAAAASRPRRIWFGEIVDGLAGPDALPLSARGIILRLRAKTNSGDVTVKLRCPDGGIGVPAWRDGPGGSRQAKIEGDWAGRRLVSASLGNDLDEPTVHGLASTPPTITPLLSAEQRRLADQMLIPLERVRLLGPIAARKWEARHDGEPEAELWEVDDLRFLEISARVIEDPNGAEERLRQRAKQGGLDLAAGQDTKTTIVLKHLATRQ